MRDQGSVLTSAKYRKYDIDAYLVIDYKIIFKGNQITETKKVKTFSFDDIIYYILAVFIFVLEWT